VTVLVLGMIVFSSTVSSITTAANSLKNIHALYDQELWAMRRFFREQHISRQLTSRVLRYSERIIKPKFQHQDSAAVKMLALLPVALNNEVHYEMYHKSLKVHPLFAFLCDHSVGLMHKICTNSLQELMLDVAELLFSPGQECPAMYFVNSGEMAYFLGEEDRITIGAKSSFCEAVLWTPWIHQGRMFAQTETAIVALGAKSFHDEAKRFGADMEILQTYAKKFVENMNMLAGNFTADEDDDCDLSDLLFVESAVEMLEGRHSENLP